MERYKVTDPNGVNTGSETLKEGTLLPVGVSGSQLSAWIRFGQVALEQSEPEAKAKGEAAESKAKSEAKAKDSK